MFLKLMLSLFVLESALGYSIRNPGFRDQWRQNDYEYDHRLQGWMKLHTEPVDWLTARVNCHMEGSFLASPWSFNFNHAVRELIRINLSRGEIRDGVLWSGVHSSFDEGALKSVEGKQVLSLQHEDLVPLDRCGVFRIYDLGEVRCDIDLPYICFAPGPLTPKTLPEFPEFLPSELPPSSTHTLPIPEFLPPDVIAKTLKKLEPSRTDLPLPVPARSTEAILIKDSSKCGDDSLGYQYAEITGHCYKFHNHAIHTWDLAKSACEAEGAYLAIVNSDEEVKVLKKIYAKKIHGAPYPDTAAIGFYWDRNYGTWITLEGESIESAGYAKWRPEAPHFTARLGFMARDGLLYGYTYDVRDVPYICEKSTVKPEEYQATELTESKSISEEPDETIEVKTVTEKLDEVIESQEHTEAEPISEDLDETIESKLESNNLDATEFKQTSEPEPILAEEEERIEPMLDSDELDESIASKWKTESTPVSKLVFETIQSKPNTESKSVTEEQDDTIELTTESEQDSTTYNEQNLHDNVNYFTTHMSESDLTTTDVPEGITSEGIDRTPEVSTDIWDYTGLDDGGLYDEEYATLIREMLKKEDVY